MYPDHLLMPDGFPTEAIDGRWRWDSVHHPSVKYPFETVVNEFIEIAKGYNCTRVLPSSRFPVYEHRIHGGYVYLGRLDGSAAAAPAADGASLAGWPERITRWRAAVESLIASVDGIEVPALRAAGVHTVDRAAPRTLLDAYNQLLDLLLAAWLRHFELLDLAYEAERTALVQLREAFPDVPEHAFASLLSPSSAGIFPYELLEQAADSAARSGLRETVGAAPDFAALRRAAADDHEARAWLEALDRIADPWFNMTNGTGLSHLDVSWHDNPDAVLEFVKRRMRELDDPRGGGACTPSADEDLLTGRLASAGSLIADARTIGRYTEDHNFYIEHWFHNRFWKKVRAFGAVLEEQGLVDDAGDVFCFTRWEVQELLYRAVRDWSLGVPSESRMRLVHDRRRRLAALDAWVPPEQAGVPRRGSTAAPSTGTDTMLFGAPSTPGPDGVLAGRSACGGSVKGRVRLVTSYDDLADVAPGEVLVCRSVPPGWCLRIGKAAAVVTDMGGVMSHAAILLRELGVPSVVGASDATRTLRTGDRVHVDADNGVVVRLADAADPHYADEKRGR